MCGKTGMRVLLNPRMPSINQLDRLKMILSNWWYIWFQFYRLNSNGLNKLMLFIPPISWSVEQFSKQQLSLSSLCAQCSDPCFRVCKWFNGWKLFSQQQELRISNLTCILKWVRIHLMNGQSMRTNGNSSYWISELMLLWVLYQINLNFGRVTPFKIY